MTNRKRRELGIACHTGFTKGFSIFLAVLIIVCAVAFYFHLKGQPTDNIHLLYTWIPGIDWYGEEKPTLTQIEDTTRKIYEAQLKLKPVSLVASITTTDPATYLANLTKEVPEDKYPTKNSKLEPKSFVDTTKAVLKHMTVEELNARQDLLKSSVPKNMPTVPIVSIPKAVRERLKVINTSKPVIIPTQIAIEKVDTIASAQLEPKKLPKIPKRKLLLQ